MTTIRLPHVITDRLVTTLRALGATAVDGSKLQFPEYTPAPWAKLKDGTVLTAVEDEKNETLVAR